jgi:hypothetical protein
MAYYDTNTVTMQDWLFGQLKDGEFAAEYLNAASEDEDGSIWPEKIKSLTGDFLELRVINRAVSRSGNGRQ